jgi:hypothetical protein
MALVNKLKQLVDQPVFEWCRFAPTATVALSALSTADDDLNRYMYYLSASSFYRYDCYSDSWQTLASPPTAPLTTMSMSYSKYSGTRGYAIAGTSTTITLAGIKNNILVGQTIRIIQGTGAGQERTITSIADAVVADMGIVTSAATASIGDSTKKWQFNQWLGYQVRLVYSTGLSQIRRVIYNDQTTLYFNDTNFQQIDSFNNTGWSSTAPYALPVTTSGLQTGYVIESSVATVNSSWTVTPDNTSKYQILSGSVWLLSSAAGAPWTTYQVYDVITDTWYTKTAIGGQLTAALGTDVSLERIGEVNSFINNTTTTYGGVSQGTLTTTGATTRTLVASAGTMTVDRWANFQIRITGGAGVGQRRRIVGNTGTTFFIERNWDTNPDTSSTWTVFADTDKMWMTGNASSVLWQYSIEADQWVTGPISDYGLARNQSALITGAGSVPHQEAIGLTSIVRVTNGIRGDAGSPPTISTAGSNYVVGDLVTANTGGTLGTFFVTTVGSTGNVTGIQLSSSGSGYTTGTTTTTGGTGSGLVISITAGITALVTTATVHYFQAGQSVTLAGNATDVTFNGSFVITGVGSLTTFSITALSSSASPTAASSQSTTVLVDSQKNWTVGLSLGEHAGKLLILNTAGPSPTTQVRRITSNTATTITVGTAITVATNGTSRYVIQDPNSFGTMQQYRQPARARDGWATSGSTTTLVDSSKAWTNNQWLNCKLRILCGNALGMNEILITGNSATTLNFGTINTAIDTTSKYQIMDSFGSFSAFAANQPTDSAKNWITNSLAGKRIRVIAGTLIGTEQAITSNSATQIVTASLGTADSSTYYEIFENAPRSTGIDLEWIFGNSNLANRGKWLLSPKGGASNTFDIFDITTGKWDITPFFQPQTETLTTGSMYCYDGADNYYFTKDATGRIFVLNLNTFQVDAAGTIPYGHSTAIIGNRFELVQQSDGLQWLYMMRHTAQEMWRVLKFW